MTNILSDHQKNELLIHACKRNDYKLVISLLKSGIHPNVLINVTKIKIEFPKSEIVLALILYGIHVHYYLAMAMEYKPDACRLLILNGARIQRGIPYRVHSSSGLVINECNVLIDSVDLLKYNIKNLLALKRRRISNMISLDRFLIKEVALAIWAERYNII